MKPTQYLNEEELVDRAVSALLKALGPVETAHFLNLRRAGRVESVRQHRRWQAILDKDKFFDQVFGAEQQ
jgi:hypothetical protein